VGWSGSECRRLHGAGGRFDVENGVLVAVVDDIVDGDGGCAGVVSDDAVDSGDGEGLVTMWTGVVRDELGGSVDIPAFFRSCGGGNSSLCAVCVTAWIVVVQVVWEVESTVQVVVVWALESTRMAVFSISVSVFSTSRPSSNPSSYPSNRAVLSRA
jgi:hypothetical protein